MPEEVTRTHPFHPTSRAELMAGLKYLNASGGQAVHYSQPPNGEFSTQVSWNSQASLRLHVEDEYPASLTQSYRRVIKRLVRHERIRPRRCPRQKSLCRGLYDSGTKERTRAELAKQKKHNRNKKAA